jgi:hypothetical protein
MKAQSLIIIVGWFAFAGCQKETLPPSEISANDLTQASSNKAAKPQEHKLNGKYTVGNYSFVPNIAAGYVPPNPAPGWYPGTATEGHLNLLGKSQAFVNMYVTFGPTGLSGTPASLNLFFADELDAMGISLPDDVAIIYFDKQGNSIWAQAIGTISITPVNATQVMFSGDAEILGGTSRFANATGRFTFSGYFNPQNTNEVGVEVTDGTIVF